ncbi:MAG TPA: type II toxin-antitoxin system VapC family toxin [Polyangia bacterium]|nr:type II toxin-antitoxin system VapC family toxin [Polyangia bacterium]
MKLLLDTHVILWSLLAPERLSARAAAELESPRTELWVSPISAWEIALLAERGRLDIDGDPETWPREALLKVPAREAPFTIEIALLSRLVPLPHQDPADRFLAATALAHDLVLLTADSRLLECARIPTLAAA